MKKLPQVLIVHCIDTEGPIGGNVRRRPDGAAEFMDNWADIERSIRRLTSPEFRQRAADSYGNSYLYNWFIMDFMGFKTNPKQRIAEYNDTYDHFKALPTRLDGFYWHYHHPPASGVGDEWSADWDSSQEYLNILLHRLVYREDWPEAFRAGGTIEDNKASLWLEKNVLVDYSNRVSDQSKPTSDIFDFNWYGAPDQWGYYHPNRANLLKPGNMRRFIVRSVDLWSRLHTLTVAEVRQAFAQAEKQSRPVILSYFSHDHREMWEETKYAIAMIKQVARETGISWRSCQALEAVQLSAAIKPVHVKITSQHGKNTIRLTTSHPLYQTLPWVGAKRRDSGLVWLDVKKRGTRSFEVVIQPDLTKIVVGGTSKSGNKFVQVL